MLVLPSRSEIRESPPGTERLVLHPVDPGDAAELWEVVDGSRSWLQPWLPWVPFQQNAESTMRFAEASVADWDSGRALRFAIRSATGRSATGRSAAGGSAAGGRLLGVVGLEACVEMHRSCDLGYWLRQEAAGAGLMTEAAALCVDFGFRTMGMHRMRVAAATDNHPSLGVIRRLRFHFEGVARHAEWCDGRWLDHSIFSLLEHEWQFRGG